MCDSDGHERPCSQRLGKRGVVCCPEMEGGSLDGCVGGGGGGEGGREE